MERYPRPTERLLVGVGRKEANELGAALMMPLSSNMSASVFDRVDATGAVPGIRDGVNQCG